MIRGFFQQSFKSKVFLAVNFLFFSCFFLENGIVFASFKRVRLSAAIRANYGVLFPVYYKFPVATGAFGFVFHN